MSDEISTQYLLALVSVRVEEIKKLIKKLRKQDSSCKEWDGYDTDIIMKRLDWLKGVADNRRADILKAKGKNPSNFEL